MPIYEFRCQRCNTKFSILVRNWISFSNAKCPTCNSSNLQRVISSFSYHRSIKTIHEEAGEPRILPSSDYYRDPRNIGRWTEKRFKELGVEMPPQIREEIQAAREGEAPKSLKEL